MGVKYPIPLTFRNQNRIMRCPFCNWTGTASDIVRSQGTDTNVMFLCPDCELPKYKEEQEND